MDGFKVKGYNRSTPLILTSVSSALTDASPIRRRENFINDSKQTYEQELELTYRHTTHG